MSYPYPGSNRAGRGHSIYDNVVGGEIMVINDENPEATKETVVTLWRANSKQPWYVWDVDEGFKSADKDLQSMVDAYNREKNEIELQDLEEQMQYEESFHA